MALGSHDLLQSSIYSFDLAFENLPLAFLFLLLMSQVSSLGANDTGKLLPATRQLFLLTALALQTIWGRFITPFPSGSGVFHSEAYCYAAMWPLMPWGAPSWHSQLILNSPQGYVAPSGSLQYHIASEKVSILERVYDGSLFLNLQFSSFQLYQLVCF